MPFAIVGCVEHASLVLVQTARRATNVIAIKVRKRAAAVVP
jgi:hypothetical protein